MRPWHLTTSSTTRHAIFPDEASRREAVLTVARVCHDELVLFCVVDDHVHVVVLCDRSRCGLLSRGLKLALGAIAAVPLTPVHISPVHGRNHMVEIHRYVLQQPAHHDLRCHPALWSGSCFLDLEGARYIPGLRLRLEDVLPRASIETSCSYVGLSGRSATELGADEVRAAGPRALTSAAAVACAAAPALQGRNAETARARRAACVLARWAGVPLREMSWALDIHPGSARKLAGSSVEPQALSSTLTYLALQQEVSSAPAVQLPADRPRDRTSRRC